MTTEDRDFNVKQLKKTTNRPVVGQLNGTLIVSCQASDGEPLSSPDCINALALSVIAGGAQGLRLEGAQNIEKVRQNTTLPIIGLAKRKSLTEAERLRHVYITATISEAKELAAAGADIIAIDGTDRPRPNGERLEDLIKAIHEDCNLPVLADISTVEEGKQAASLGADLISTTLHGYTEETSIAHEHGPGFNLLEELALCLAVPVILEGRVWVPQEVARAFELGAYAVVVGSAITRPQLITARFVRAIQSKG